MKGRRVGGRRRPLWGPDWIQMSLQLPHDPQKETRRFGLKGRSAEDENQTHKTAADKVAVRSFEPLLAIL